jgi:hypothetical protein
MAGPARPLAETPVKASREHDGGDMGFGNA